MIYERNNILEINENRGYIITYNLQLKYWKAETTSRGMKGIEWVDDNPANCEIKKKEGK